jgi:hypothetical protein
MIPLRFGSAGGFEGPGGHERGHVCTPGVPWVRGRVQAPVVVGPDKPENFVAAPPTSKHDDNVDWLGDFLLNQR